LTRLRMNSRKLDALIYTSADVTADVTRVYDREATAGSAHVTDTPMTLMLPSFVENFIICTYLNFG
ncbi:hypothetical protein L9F63_004132, partial [Diploptera punctata]